MALEDAVVLGRFLGRLSSMEQLSMFIQAFHELRQARGKFCAQTEAESHAMTTLPPGPEAEFRNSHFVRREDMVSYSDASESEDQDIILRKQLEGFANIFGYDATDAADEWWIQWGRFSERQRYLSNADDV